MLYKVLASKLKVMAEESNQNIIQELIAEGKKRWEAPRTTIDFETKIPESEKLLNNIEEFPHLFVLACVMNKQISAGRVWTIPYRVGKELGGFEFSHYRDASLTDITKIFNRLTLHRFNNEMARVFKEAVEKIHGEYRDDASKIWSDPKRPKSALVVRRFLEFRGAGVKIATMATNILARDFKVPMEDYSSIDVSPDIQVRKCFVHYGLIRKEASKEELIYRAREIYPQYPGLLDFPAWERGRKL